MKMQKGLLARSPGSLWMAIGWIILGVSLPLGAVVLDALDVVVLNYEPCIFIFGLIIGAPFLLGILISLAPVRLALRRLGAFLHRHRRALVVTGTLAALGGLAALVLGCSQRGDQIAVFFLVVFPALVASPLLMGWVLAALDRRGRAA